MTYEMIETMIEELNVEITKISNKVAELSWLGKDFNSSKINALNNKMNALISKKYELIELIRG